MTPMEARIRIAEALIGSLPVSRALADQRLDRTIADMADEIVTSLEAYEAGRDATAREQYAKTVCGSAHPVDPAVVCTLDPDTAHELHESGEYTW